MSITKSSGSMRAHAQRVLAHQSKTAEADAEPESNGAELLPDAAFVATSAPPVKVKRRVTIPVLAFPAGSAIVCRIIEAIHESKVEDSRFPGPASVCQIEAPGGEVRVLIAGTVLKAALLRDYPKDDYVGRWFHIAKLPQRGDKTYADYAITEIEAPVAQSAQESLAV